MTNQPSGDRAASQNERTVLCYGDSNTWGYIPGSNAERLDRLRRWPGILASDLGTEYRVLEEGLNGRTTVLDDPLTPYRNGREYLVPCIRSHQPLDLVVIFLGTNDLADRYPLPALDIARAVVSLAEIVRSSNTGRAGSSPAVLMLGLPRLGSADGLGETMTGAAARAADLPRCFRLVANEADVPFLDLAELVAFSDIDGVHLDIEGHQIVGHAVATEVRRILA